MLRDLIEYLIDRSPRRPGWTWQRHAFAPVIAAAITLGVIYLTNATAHWWVPLLFGLIV